MVVTAEGVENEGVVVVKVVGVVMGERVEVVAVEMVVEVEGVEELVLATSEVTAAGVVSALGGVMGCTATAGLMPEPQTIKQLLEKYPTGQRNLDRQADRDGK